MTVASKPTSQVAPTVDDAARPTDRSVRPQLMIFAGVNAVLLLAWVSLLLAGVTVHGVWTWPVVMLLWLGRILLIDRRVRRERVFTDEQIEREVRKIR